jgi:nucleoside-diphosphate-sugar epimerase
VLRACAELGITRVCQLSSINAIGSAYTPYKVVWDSLPLDETSPARPADTYALSKL